MSIAKAYAAQLIGLKSEIITIEVDISNGLHHFSIVGLGDRSVEEAKDRVSAAIKNSGYISPKQKNQKIVVSLAPADVRKEGPSFDLSIALAYLAAAGEIDFDPEKTLFLGELALQGNIRRISGLLPILCQAAERGFIRAFVPIANIDEASLAQGITVYGSSSLKEVTAHLHGSSIISPIKKIDRFVDMTSQSSLNMQTVRGNNAAKRGLEIAAAGAHNAILYGPPGTGKTMLAHATPSILPHLTYEQSIEVTSIHSAARSLEKGLLVHPPFRSPHHTASYASIVGGGPFPRPGEVTLAHRGILFLDEFPEFDRMTIEALRQPLEERSITISRSRGVVTFPAQFMLIASMNPCPCGKGRGGGCTCPTNTLDAYKRKISGPIIDRIDIWLNVHKIEYDRLASPVSDGEDSDVIRKRVTRARDIQHTRFDSLGIPKNFNSEMSAQDIEKCAHIENDARTLLTASTKRLGLSGRAFHRIIKVARTIADLGESESISSRHILEALQYRQKPT